MISWYALDCVVIGHVALYVRLDWVSPIRDEKCDRMLKLCKWDSSDSTIRVRGLECYTGGTLKWPRL